MGGESIFYNDQDKFGAILGALCVVFADKNLIFLNYTDCTRLSDLNWEKNFEGRRTGSWR